MKVLRGIDRPIGGEHVLRVVPELGPYAVQAAGEPALRKRLHFFPQRSLTHVALIDEQHSRIDAAMRLGESVAPGIIDGLELAVERDTLVLLPGHAIAPDGRGIELAYPLHIPFHAIGVVSPRVEEKLKAQHTAAKWKRLSTLQRETTLAEVLRSHDGASFLPHAMVLVAVPRSVALDRQDTNSPCPNATDDRVYSGAAWEDGFQLVWSPWPEERALPLWTSDGATVDGRFRNRLAYAVFNAERERLSVGLPRSMRQWRDRSGLAQLDLDDVAREAVAVARSAAPWPWEALGVPIAMVAFDKDFKPNFADRATVVRQGGGRRNRSALVPRSGDDVLWQARVSQMLEHLAELPADQRNVQALVGQFDWLPPAGVLPRDVADFVAGKQNFFPPQFDVQARPIPLDMVDALIAESSPLLPFNLSLRDQVQILVPVPARFFDPDLLKLDLHVHPFFDMEIARLGEDRRTLLTRRDGLRRRFDYLLQAVVGDLPSYPQDDQNALPDETGALDALAFNRVHRSHAAADRGESHEFSGAHVKLEFQASDELIAFVRIDIAPPGIGIRPIVSVEPDAAPVETPPFVWGTSPAGGRGDRVGDLPRTGVWTRLSVPMSRAGLAGRKIDGLAFEVFSGATASEVTWGYAGKAANGTESYWLSDALPPGAQTKSAASWVWAVQGEASTADADNAIGLPIEPDSASASSSARPHTRHVSELDRLLESWKAFHDGALTVELGEPKDGKRTATTPPRTVDGGLDELIARLDGRVRAASDHVDFGFMRARTDIFRLRQSMLGTADAGRFLTSASAADLVKRNENPTATEKEFADYFQRLGQKAVAPPDFRAQPGHEAPAAIGVAARMTVPSSAFALSSNNPRLFTAAATASRAFRTDAVRTTAGVATGAVPAVAGPTAAAGRGAAPPRALAAKAMDIGFADRRALLNVEASPAVKGVVAASLAGATYNTVTLAERISMPASVVSSNAAAKGKHDFVVNGLRALKDSGLVVDDLQVFGYQNSGTTTPAKITAAELLKSGTAVVDLDAADVGTDQHEAVYFRRGVDAIDNAIRFLRGMELRAEDYRRLQSDAMSARERILGVTARIQDSLATLSLRLAEVRHDLSVARTLRAEEAARIGALIARRKAVLAEQVPYLVFRRPRVTLVLQDVPVLPAQPADVPDVVPRCRGNVHDAPPELLAMVDTLRDVPVRWLKRISQILVKLDRVTDLERVVAQVSQRVFAREAIEAPGVLEGAHTMTGVMVAATFGRVARRASKNYEQSAARLERFDASSWKVAVDKVRDIATIRDLLQAVTSRREVTLAASGLLDDVAGVASCLHAAFCTVPPATRLRWAELFSQLDPAVPLRTLTVLPGFGDESLGVDYIAWRQMQRMVDWLFAQVASDAGAQEAINDLVRVCLLLASHAPVKRIISARIRRPVPAVIDARLDIEIDPRITRIGMQVLVHAPTTQAILVRAVIEDLADDIATARITDAPAGAGLTLDGTMRVQVQAGPPLTTPAVQRAEAARAQSDAIPGAAAKAAARGTQHAAEAAAERRVAKQIEALRGVGKRVGGPR